jgi:hypothetical protein
MTIHVQQDVLVTLQSSYSWPISESEEFLLFRKKAMLGDNEMIEHDDDSVLTLSTASLSDTDDSVCFRVSFAEELVTEVWTRPYTAPEDVSDLYYSTEETNRYVIAICS